MAVFAKQAVELADILEPAETAVALVDSTAVAGPRVVGVEPAAAVEESERHVHHSEDAWESAGAAQSV